MLIRLYIGFIVLINTYCSLAFHRSRISRNVKIPYRIICSTSKIFAFQPDDQFEEFEGDEDDEDDVEYVDRDELLSYWESAGRNDEDFDEQKALLSYLGSKKGFISELRSKPINSLADSFKELKKDSLSIQKISLSNISVGIDLGTSNSAISYISDGLPNIIPIDGSNTVPSAICYHKDGSIAVGKVALKRRLLDPNNTFLSIKRVIGQSAGGSKLLNYQVQRNKTDSKSWGFKSPNANKSIRPEEISAEVLKYLLLNAQKALNIIEPIKRAVITVPAYFNADQCAATVKAGNLAGLDKVKLLREPEAAAFAYGLTQREKQIILVFDLGGGTFDVSVLDVGDGFAEVIATSGDSHLGGDDFDTAIMNWIVDEYMKLPSVTSPIGNVDFLTRAREEAEKAKIALSTIKEHNITLQGLPGEPELRCTLTRARFESLTSKLLGRLLTPIREVALMAGINLAGESLNSDLNSIDLIDMYSKKSDGTLLDDVSYMKKQQQSGRQSAKNQKKIKASLGKELNRLKTEIGDNTISTFPGGFSSTLDDIILVGGATRIPAVQKIIYGLTGIKPRITVNPDEAVSLGAAVYAGTLDGILNNMQVMSTWQAAIFRAFYESYQKDSASTASISSTTSNNTANIRTSGDGVKIGEGKKKAGLPSSMSSILLRKYKQRKNS